MFTLDQCSCHLFTLSLQLFPPENISGIFRASKSTVFTKYFPILQNISIHNICKGAGKPRSKKNGKKGDIVPFRRPPLNGQKGDICCLKKSVYRDKCVFATKERMFRVLGIIEILHYGGLPIPDPTS